MISTETSETVIAMLDMSGGARSRVARGCAAKRKHGEWNAVDTLRSCDLCNTKYVPADTTLNLSVSACCNRCSKKTALIATLLRSKDRTRSRTPVEEIYLSLNGMEMVEAAMACLGSFLTVTERALFGVALNPSGPTKASEMITGRNVAELDFLDVDKSLAGRLTDEHLKCVLINLDAKHHLKRLKLTGCGGITGIGLEPLRGSRALELIDLSLIKLHEDPKKADEDDACNLSEAIILDILGSIINQGEQSSLKYIQFHKYWRMRSSSWFRDFLSRYKTFQRIYSWKNCTLCSNSSAASEGCNTCYLCLESECEIHSSYCVSCEKDFCSRCIGFRKCQGGCCPSGNKDHCMECLTVCKTCDVAQCSSCNMAGGKCSKCGNEWCGSFGTNCMGEYCYGCGKPFCDNCTEFDYCCCGEAMCDSCRRTDKCDHDVLSESSED